MGQDGTSDRRNRGHRRLFGRAIWLQVTGLLIGSVTAAYLWFQSRTFIYSRWFEKSEDSLAWMEKLGDHAEMYIKVSYMETFVSALTLMLATLWSISWEESPSSLINARSSPHSAD